MLRVKQLRAGRWFSYLVYDDVSREALVVDPVPGLCDLFELMTEDADLSVRAVVETQCHWHRISSARSLHEMFNAPRCLSAAGNHPAAHEALRDGETLRLGEESIVAHGAPGISPDAMVLAAEGFALTGNTLLLNGSGALGLPGSCAAKLYETTQRIFSSLGDETVVYPAQDAQGRLFSTLGAERAQGADVAVADRSRFVARKQQAPAVVPSAALQRIWTANRAPERATPGALSTQDARPDEIAPPPAAEVVAVEAQGRCKAGTPLLDVREDFELMVGEIPGAVHAPLSELGGRLQALEPTETLALCAHGNRSAWTARTLSRLGVPTISVAGGLAAWRDAGLEVA
ncbi:MAG: rhodanese-like domain-containing protein [Myxococcales bacterium]|nr:rhodanese-like domain-containing protein [Myxococcales bacterium]